MKKLLVFSPILFATLVFVFSPLLSFNNHKVLGYEKVGCDIYNPVVVSAEPNPVGVNVRTSISIDATKFLSCVISSMNTKDWVASFVYDFGDGTRAKVFLAPGDSFRSSRSHTYATADSYTASVTADAGGPGGPFPETSTGSVTITVTASPPPPTPPASMTHTANTSSVDVGGSVITSGSGTNVTSCSKTATIPPGKPSVVYSEFYPVEGGNVTVPKTTVTGFSQPTADTPYYLNLTCNGNFASLNKASNLAGILEPFLGFVKVAYAAPSSNTISLPVYVNALPNAVLNVNSSGVSGVPIDGLSGLPDFTTDDTYTKTSTISGTLLAPAQWGGKDFTGWGGDCAGINNYACNVSVPTGSIKTVTVYYSQPVPSQPNLRISGGISVNPASPSVGEQVDFSATVLNNGGSSAGSNSTTKLKIDLYNNGRGSLWDQTSNKTTGNLASGATETETWNNVWTAIEGTHRIRVCADDSGIISESNESDNCANTYITVSNEEEPPPPPPLEDDFNYSLSNSGLTSVEKGSVDVYTQNTITKTLTDGSSQSVNLSVSGVPSGVTTSFSNKTCSPTCNSTITFTVSPSAPTGNHSITVTGSPLSKTTNFTLSITGSAMSIDCVPSPATAMIGQPVTWTANVSGGTAPYTYSWSGSGIPTEPAPDVNPYSVTYSTTGQKNATVQVTDDNSQTASCPANSSAQINFNPTFEEF